MPLYEYACGACGTVSEINHRISAPAPTDCPECGKPALSKLMSASNFRLKGAGWYETDFKSEGKRNLAGDGESAEKSAGSTEYASATSTAGSETKAAAAPKSEAKADKPKADAKPAAKAPPPAASKPAKPSGAGA